MSTKSLFPISIGGTVSGNNPQTIRLPEKAAMTYFGGAILTLDANGMVAEAGADPVRVIGVATRPGQNGTADGDKYTELWVANRDNLFRANLFHTSAGNASSVWDHRYVGRAYGLVKVSNNWHIDLADITNRRAIIQCLDPGSVPGDLQPEVLFQFLSLFSALTYTS